MTMQSGDEVTVPVTGGRELLVRCLSSSPKIAIIKQFLTDSECDLIIEKSKPHLESSHVMGKAQNSELAQDAYRISENAWLAPGELHPLLPDVQARLSAVTGLPIAYLSQMSEQLQVRADELLWMIYLSVRIQVTDIFVYVCVCAYVCVCMCVCVCRLFAINQAVISMFIKTLPSSTRDS
jgi:hypothetical protein